MHLMVQWLAELKPVGIRKNKPLVTHNALYILQGVVFVSNGALV